MSREVTFKLPDDVWWQLAERADELGVQVPEIMARIIREQVVIPRGEQITESVLRLHHAGLTIPLIARRLNMTNSSVQGRLYKLGLRGNKRAGASVSVENEREAG